MDQLQNNYQGLRTGNQQTQPQQQNYGYSPGSSPMIPNVPAGIPGISQNIPSTGQPRTVSPEVESILRGKFPQQYQGMTAPSSAPSGQNRNSGDPSSYIQGQFGSLPANEQGYLQLINSLQQQGYDVQRPYRGRGMQGEQSGDKIVVNGRMIDVMGDNGWQYADIGSAEEHGYGPGGDGFYRGPSGGSSGGGYLGGLSGALSGYDEFAKTGGLSEQDRSNIRARAVAPIRSIYAQGRDELERQRALSGGYMPNFAPAQAKMAREQSYALSDKSIDTEAALAQLIQSGRLSGLQGQSGLGTTLAGQELQLADMGNRFGLGLTNAQTQASQVPGNFSQAMGNIGSVLGLAAPFVNPIMGAFGGGNTSQPNYPSYSQYGPYADGYRY